MNFPADLGSATLATVDPGAARADNAPSKTMPALVQLWLIVLRRKFVIAPILILFVIGGLVATLLMTPEYTGIARLEISRNKENVTNLGELQQEDSGPDLEFYQTQYALLEARTLAERVANHLKLTEDQRFLDAFNLERPGAAMFTDNEGRRLTGEQRELLFRQIVSTLRGNVAIAPIRDSSLVDVRFVSSDSELAALIANTWASQFIQANLDQRFESTTDAQKFLEGRLNQLRLRLEQSERDLVSYASGQQIVTLTTSEGSDGKTRTERTLIADNLEALNNALSVAIADRIAAQSRIRRGGSTPGSAMAGGPAVSSAVNALRQTRAEVAADYSKMLAQFEPDYPAAKAIASQLESLDRDITREERRIGGGLVSDYEEALQRENQLRASVDRLKAAFTDQRRSGIQYNIYQREVDTNRQLYDALLQRYKEIGVAGVGASNVVVVDPAEVPSAPSSPNLALNLLVAALLGGIVAGATTLALEHIDERISDPTDVSRTLRLPLLGVVPMTREIDPFEDLDDQKSSTSEAYFSVLTSLGFSTDHGVPRSLIVTSTQPGEGKSITAAALARILARVGKTVVLIDADMRSPSVNEYFGTKNDEGLSNYLAGADDWRALVKDSGHGALKLLTTGPQPPNAAELLSSERMASLIRTLTENFNHVIVDMPPVLGLADTPLVSSQVEGVVYVIAANMTRGRLASAALERLTNARGRLLGAIFTKFSASSHLSYGFDYGYGKEAEHSRAS